MPLAELPRAQPNGSPDYTPAVQWPAIQSGPQPAPVTSDFGPPPRTP